MTFLCVPIFVESPEQAKSAIARAIEFGADLIELRIDSFDGERQDVELANLLSTTQFPILLTNRPTNEGGQSESLDLERKARLEQFSGSVDFVDIEHATLQRLKNPSLEVESKLIVSSHDFTGRPDRLYNIIREISASPADIVKIVWTARSIRDNLEAFEILLAKQKPTIAVCMGEAGIISRILAKKFGGFLTFASLTSTSGTAPGQVTIEEMKRIYRWDAINPQTKVYGVVGAPIMHSMSPAIHNAGFDEVGFDGIYLPLRVEPGYESFKAFMETFLAFEPLHLSGLSITIPHKENALRYLQEKGGEIEPLAIAIGALNTIAIERTGEAIKLKGINTDYAAILDSITSKMGTTREELKNYRVAVIGAGGTGRTAVAALSSFGATVVVYNRTFERAVELAKEFNGKTGHVVAAKMEKLCDSCCHIYINTTSVGMYPKVDETPLGDREPQFSSDTVVFDTIYNPIQTKLLKQAEQLGAKTIPGIEMFVRQAKGQFELWTGKPAPTATMRRIIEARLTPVR